jgi:hypothetical protein
MNYSLLRADYRTHLKILALAVFMLLCWICAYGTNIAWVRSRRQFPSSRKPHLNNA